MNTAPAVRGLRHHLRTIVLAAVLPTLFAGVALVIWLWQREQQRALDGSLAATRSTALAVERELEGTQRVLLSLAQSAALRAGRLDEFYEIARRVLPEQHGWGTIIVAAPDGRQLVNLRRPFGTELPAMAPTSPVEQVALTGTPAVSNVFTGRVSGMPVVDVAVPALHEGALKYVLVAAYEAQAMNALLKGATPEGGIASILDREKRFVTRSREPEKFVGKHPLGPFLAEVRSRPEGFGHFSTYEGDSVYSAWTPVGDTGWTVGVAMPAAPVLASLRAALIGVLGMALLAAAIGAWWALRAARRVERPLLALAAGLEAEGATSLPVPSGIAEIDRLAVALERAGVDRRAAQKADQAVRNSEERLREVIRQLPAAVGVTDLAGRWLLTNPLMDRYVPVAIPSTVPDRVPRWRLEDAQGQPVPPQDWPGQRALRGETVAPGVEALFRDDSGNERWMRVAAAPLRDSAAQIMGSIVIVQDIDAAKRAEDALRETDRRRSEFLATLAHELRNPLAPVRNAVQVLNMKAIAAKDSTWARDVIDRQVQHMARLIDDLMDMSRISQGRVELRRERVTLERLIQMAVETSRPLVEQGGHELTVVLPALPLWLDADATRLAQVFSNVLTNAAKYTERGGKIRIAAVRHRGELEVAISDTGIGIPREQLGTIFELFAQADGARERAQGGLGIGLSLAKRLTEMHGGRIEAKSEGRGKGSTFVVRLPLAASDLAAPDGPNTDIQGAAGAQLRILIVDDNRDAADSLEMMLRMSGHDVRAVYDGQRAVAAAAEFQPQVALLDIGLPLINGYEVCRRIRFEPWGQGMLLIAVSGWGQNEDQRRGAEAGFDRHLVKPVDPAALLALLDKALVT